jgi:hypothetical protein
MTLSYPGDGSVFNITQTTVAADLFLPYTPQYGRVYFPRTSAKEYNPRNLDLAVTPIVFGQNTQVDALVFRLIRNYAVTEGNTNGIEIRAALYEADPSNPIKPLTLLTPDVLYKKILPRDIEFDGETPNPYYSEYPGQQWAVVLPFSYINIDANKHYFVGAALKEIPGESYGGQMPQVDCHVGTGLFPFADEGMSTNDVQYYTTPSAWYLDYPNYVFSEGTFATAEIGSTLPYVSDAMVGTALKVGVRIYD